MLIDEKDRGPECPRCKRTVINLISLTDDGKGRKICIDCKRKIKKRDPNRDYRKAKFYNGTGK